MTKMYVKTMNVASAADTPDNGGSEARYERTSRPPEI
jgi:hypothetical protein